MSPLHPLRPRVVRNDWSSLTVPEIGAWRPRLPVSVVIPAYDCQQSLDLTLASLARQTYPAELLEVVVVDDGTAPPLELPKICPENCRLVRTADHSAGWGRANALSVGAAHSDGEVIHWLDADMVVFPEHVEAQVRWHHEVPYAVTLGYKRFVGASWPTPDEVADACAAGDAGGLFDLRDSKPHDYVEELIRRTDQLRAGDHLNFLVHVGATAALRRELYEAAGGIDVRLRLGEDTELGYRLAQAGALFVPEPRARSWHLGPTHMMRHEAALQRYNRPFLADLMPQPRWLRKVGGSAWAVPLVVVVVEVGGQPLERVRAVVDAVLASDEADLRVCLVGPWDSLGDGRVRALSDPQLELRLIEASYRSDPRVHLVDRAPETAFPAPYLLRVPVTQGLARSAVRRLLDVADRYQVGLVRVVPPDGREGNGGEGNEPGGEADGQPPVELSSVELWRTAALGRARWTREDGESLADVVTATHGARTVLPEAIGVVDLSRRTAAQLAPGAPAVWAAVGRPGRWLPNAVEVAGVRSLGRATLLVMRLAAARAWARVRRRATGSPPVS